MPPIPRRPRSGAPDLASLRATLVAWYRTARRDLPWRRTRDPYRIWLAEIMLQQTRVDVVVPYWERFLARFPDVAGLAAAPLESVLSSWSGLGYYRRARHLHAAAQRIVREHGGRFPVSPDDIAALPGIGRYTAGAVGSIAFGHPAPILDGNVVRVFARLFGIAGDVEAAAVRRRMWEIASAWAACDEPGDANQALMELGALVCVKPEPRCAVCPLAASCVAHRTGRARSLPHARRRPATRRVALVAALVAHRGRLLAVQRAGATLLDAWWEVPVHAAGDDTAREIAAHCGVRALEWTPLGDVRHAILQNALRVRVVGSVRTLPAPPRRSRPRLASRRRTPTPSAPQLANLELEGLRRRWLRPTDLAALPVTTLTRKVLRTAARVDPRWQPFDAALANAAPVRGGRQLQIAAASRTKATSGPKSSTAS